MATFIPFMSTRLVILNENAPVMQASRAMCARHVGCILVSNSEGSLTGIVTDRDLVCEPVKNSKEEETLIGEIMTPSPVYAEATATRDDIIALMEANGVRRIPIVEKRKGGIKHCVGVVSLDDLIAARAIDPERLSNIIKAQIARHVLPEYVLMRIERKQQRSQAHREQTLRQFHKRIGEEIGVTQPPMVSALTFSILGSLTRRLTSTEAAHLISQLPGILQEQLWAIPSGPDRDITADSMIKQMNKQFQLKQQDSRRILQNFFSALYQLVSPNELDDVKAQLPPDLKALFPSPKSGEPEVKKAA